MKNLTGQKQEETWENEFDLFYGEAPKGTLKYLKRENVKGFIRGLLLKVKEEYKGNTIRIWYEIGFSDCKEAIYEELREKLEQLKDKMPKKNGTYNYDYMEALFEVEALLSCKEEKE